MHEFSICQSILDIVTAELSKFPPPLPRLLKTRIKVGAFRQVVPDFLQNAYSILSKNSAVEGSSLDIECVPARGVCRSCKWNGDLDRLCFYCPTCKSEEFEVSGGMDLCIKELEMEDTPGT